MPTKVTLNNDNIDGAAEQIIHLLESTNKGEDIIYFHGWDGWGASAVLKEVVKRLRSSLGSADIGRAGGLEKIIHVDFSRWQSMRALQKAIAEELELPQQVMALFDQHDEEDDFDGVEQSARGVIPHVKFAIMNELMARRFLVVLHNWSGNYIDLWEAGVPVSGQLSKRVLWTSRGRFWHHAKDGHGLDWQLNEVELAKWSDATIYVLPSPVFEEEDEHEYVPSLVLSYRYAVFRKALYAEAKEVAKYTGVPEPDMSQKIVIECILYMALRRNDQDISWESHASNYWVCDGIIQDGTDGGRSAWEIGDALQRNMILDFCSECAAVIYDVLGDEQQRFIDHLVKTSFFWTAAAPSTIDQNRTRLLKASIFEHSDRSSSLRVIHLSYCNFSFSSPPFLSCNNLRFLILHHCNDQDAQGGEGKEYHHRSNYRQQAGNGACFWNLWVLELSYTDWYWLLSKDTLDLMVDLRELNVKGVDNQSMMHLRHCSGAGRNNRRLVKLRVVADSNKDHGDGVNGDRNEQVSSPVVASSFPDLSSWHILKTVVLDGCGNLELIDYNTLPLSLESFTLISNVASKIKRISFRGHTKLKSLLLRGLFHSLVELDMSGTAIRTLDLSATQAWGLRRLFLLGCEKLCAILWPPQEKYIKEMDLEILRIDTTTTTYAALLDSEEGKSSKQQVATSASDSSASISMGSSAAAMVCGKDPTITDSDSYISVRDPRLFRSLVHLRLKRPYRHVDISSSTGGHKGTASQGIHSSNACGQQKPAGNLYCIDDIISTTFNSNSQADGADRADPSEAEASTMKSMWLWHCPPIPTCSDWAWAHCYISIQDERRTESLQGTTSTTSTSRQLTLPGFVHEEAMTLHLHDSLSITCLPGPAPATATTEAVDLEWNYLGWCRLERCPNLEGVVFTTPTLKKLKRRVFPPSIFWLLKTFWASQLPKARYIWDWSTSGFLPGESSFSSLVFLHLDYCPRLVHVLPLYTLNSLGCHRLETLEIVCCGDLREVFPSDSESQQQEEPRRFPRLKRIHLYELPKLQRICGRRMVAPNLETVKVRGCWGLKHLPVVGRRRSAPPVVDCEKDWWDGLEWDGESAGHHPSHYKPSYSSAYYKKKQLRASVLR